MKAKVSGTKKKINGTTFLLMITILLFVVMYAAGMIVFNDKGFAKPQMFLNLFISNAGLLVIAMGETIVMITAGIDISVGSVTALVCMVAALKSGTNCTRERNRRKRLYRTSYGTGDRTSLWSGSGIPGILSGDPAIHCNTGRYVLWTWYDINHQYRYDFYQKCNFHGMG